MMIVTQQLKEKKCKEIKEKLERKITIILCISALFRRHFQHSHFSTKMGPLFIIQTLFKGIGIHDFQISGLGLEATSSGRLKLQI